MESALHRSALAPSLALFVLGLVGACHREQPDPLARCAGLIGLPQRNPVADADVALAHHDQRVLMLGGFGAYAPGTERFAVTGLAREVGKPAPFSGGARFIGGRLLHGTSDTETRACNALRPPTERYVLAYNRRIVAHLTAAPRS